MQSGQIKSAVRLWRAARPGWPEIVLGLLVIGLVGYGGGSQLHRVGLSPVLYRLVFAGLSGAAGLLAFGAAVSLRIRNVGAFGVRRTTAKWLLSATALGVVAVAGKVVIVLAITRITHSQSHVQDVYAVGGRGDLTELILATLLLGVLTPIGEELLFRGVLTTALLRYGWLVAVGGSASIFALMHGLNLILPVALLEGVLAAEIYRRSGSVWPAVIVHVVFNLPTVPIMVLSSSTR